VKVVVVVLASAGAVPIAMANLMVVMVGEEVM
jgi:hypothetical protein